MVYKFCSSKEVLAQFIGRTRLSDNTYANDLLEWLRDGINMLKVRKSLEPTHACVEVCGHLAKLPCGMQMLDGVYYNGKRLRMGTGATDTRFKGYHKLEADYQSYFQSDTSDPAYVNQQDYRLIRGDDLKPSREYNTEDYYIPAPNYFQTSFEEGTIVIFYRRIPVDEHGYPMIPDNENIKYSLFWWLMAQITFTGFKHADPGMNYEYCERKHKEYGRRGKEGIKYWNVDERESVLNLTTNLIPPYGYYDTFFIGGETTKSVGGL